MYAWDPLLFIAFIAFDCFYCGFRHNFQIRRRGQLVLLYFHIVPAETAPFTQWFAKVSSEATVQCRWAPFIIYCVYWHLLRLLAILEQIPSCRPRARTTPFIIYCVYCILLRLLRLLAFIDIYWHFLANPTKR